MTTTVYSASYVDNVGDKMLRGLNSGLYYQTVLFGEVLILNQKNYLLLWRHTKA